MTFLKYLVLLLISIDMAVASVDRDSDIWDVVDDIFKQLEEKEARITQLENIVHAQQKTIDLLERQIATQGQIQTISEDELSSDGNETASDVKLKGQTVRSISASKPTKRNRIRQADLENPVAFLASVSSHTHDLGANQNIEFDNVITNIGNAYNSHAGLFIAPVSGIYLFSATILDYPNINGHFEIQKNNAVVTRLYVHSSVSVYDTSSSTVVLQLAKGDDLSVVNMDLDTSVIGNHYCSFTGVLLFETYDDSPSVVGK